MLRDERRQLAERSIGWPFDAQDHVARLQAGLVAGAVLLDASHERAARTVEPEGLGELLRFTSWIVHADAAAR